MIINYCGMPVVIVALAAYIVKRMYVCVYVFALPWPRVNHILVTYRGNV